MGHLQPECAFTIFPQLLNPVKFSLGFLGVPKRSGGFGWGRGELANGPNHYFKNIQVMAMKLVGA